MGSSTTSALAILWLGIVLAAILLVLMSGELGRRWLRRQRTFLAGAIGLGIIALTLKATLFLWLHHNLASAARRPGSPPAASHDRQPVAAPGGLAVWRALPRRAPEPSDNPTTAAKVALGEALFHDKRLSRDQDVACADCHILAQGGDDGRSFSVGTKGALGGRNAPSVWNAAFFSRLFWDGRAASLEEQAAGPLLHPKEMAMPTLEAVAERVNAIHAYRPLLTAAFGEAGATDGSRVTRALAAFERTLITPGAPYDRFVRGDRSALTAQQKRGMGLFNDLGCRSCHRDPLFSAAGSVNPFGVYRTFPIHREHREAAYHGLMEDSGRDGKHRWRVPSLRNAARTAPYFHNGSVERLEEAVRLMGLLQLNRKLEPAEIEDIAAFIKGLNGPGKS